MNVDSSVPIKVMFGLVFALVIVFANAQIAHAQWTPGNHVTSAGNTGGANSSDTTRKLEVNGTVKRGRGFFFDDTQGMERVGSGYSSRRRIAKTCCWCLSLGWAARIN